MAVRSLALLSGVLLIAGVALAGPSIDDSQLPPTYMPTGEQMYKQYCATCHGADARGNGPLAVMLKTPPPDLTTLSRRHAGKFPYDYVADVIEFGTRYPYTVHPICLPGGRSSVTSTNRTKRLSGNASRISAII